MRIENIQKAVCISALIHAALFGVVLYMAYHGSTDVPGDGSMGETIAVSMISEDGSIGSSGENLEVKQSKPVEASSLKLSPPMAVPSKSTDATASSSDTAGGASAKLPPPDRRPATTASADIRAGGTGDPRLMRMWKKINRSKYYPLNARRNSLKGNPRVTFKTGEQGQVEYVRLAKSCGITQLDDAAIETVKRAAPLPYYPKPITLTIRYSMKE